MSNCLPRGLPSLNSFQTEFAKIVQTPAVVVIIYEGASGDVLRTIFADGRGLPEDPNPTWLGYSIGRWEGETLVVSTSGFNDRGWLDFNGHPQTESLHVTERYRRRDFGHMEYEMTLEDPKVFVKPVSLKLDKILVPDTEFQETICENEKDASHAVGGNGFVLSSEKLARYAGTYEFSRGGQTTVTLNDGFFVWQENANGPRRTLVPQSETLFVFREGADAVEFVLDLQGSVTKLIAHLPAGDQEAIRKR